MKNLELFQLVRKNFKDTYEDVTHIAFQDDCVFFLRNNLLHLQDQHELKVFDDIYTCITEFETLKIERILWFGTGKEFVWVDCLKQLHIVPLNFEFNAAAWNPSQDAVAVVQPDGEVGVFMINFNDETVMPMGISHLTDIVPTTVINVGWGSENTQFRGTAGKLLKIENMDIAVNNNDDLKPRITWRGNGDMFAVNYWHNGLRKFKVFKFPCDLLYESSEIVGLQPIIAWKPEGNLICSVTHTTKKCEISLFEKNGLIKNSIALETNLTEVVDVKWSFCGQILAIHQRFCDDFFIDLYTVKNYVWYLKQRLNFARSNPLIKFEFTDNMSSVISLLVTTTRETLLYSFKFVVHVSCLYEGKSDVTCAAINGRNIWLTNCEKGMAPPPMFDRKITMDNPVNFLQFHPTVPKLAVVDCSNNLHTFDLDTCNQLENFVDLLGGLDVPIPCHHFIWSFDSQIMYLKEEETGAYKALLCTNDKKLNYWQNDKEKALAVGVTYLDADYNDGIYLEQIHKDVVVLNKENIITSTVALPSVALRLRYLKINGTPLVLSLTQNQEFLVNEVKVLNGVLSFTIHQKYLLLTTNENTLVCIRLKSLLARDVLKNAYYRAVEQGSYLLLGLPNSSSVVLQMPRGNIELCAVRIISIDRLEHLLQHQNWRDAIDLVRLERMNTTILIDLNYNRFIESIDKFVQSIETPALISDFLLGLQEENVLKTLYKECAFDNTQEVAGKIEKVCNALIHYLQKHNYRYYLNCIIIACFVKNSKSSNSDALAHIQNLLHAMKEDRSVIKIAESAFSSINTLKPNSDMFSNALLLYDLDLALFVARNLQMDPKEYEPFIAALKGHDEIKRRFVINDHLKNYDVSVRYLVRTCCNDDDVIEYVKKHGVYASGYNYTKHGSELHKKIAILFAEHLRKQKLYEEAGTVLSSVKLFSDAFEDYTKGLVITSALLTLSLMKLPSDEHKKNLRKLAQACIDARKIKEAGIIYERHLLDYDIAMDLYIRNHYFEEAHACASVFNCYESNIYRVFEITIKYSRELESKLKDMKDTFDKYRLRLATVRTGKIEKFHASHDSHQMTIIDDSLSIADTLSTVVTSSSRASTVSRRRKKEERKKQDLREGGVYEDIALMRALYELISEVFSLGPVVRELYLITFNMSSGADRALNALHNFLFEFQMEINKAITEIWPPHLNNPDEDDSTCSIYENVKVLDVKYREPPPNLDTSWKLHILSQVL